MSEFIVMPRSTLLLRAHPFYVFESLLPGGGHDKVLYIKAVTERRKLDMTDCWNLGAFQKEVAEPLGLLPSMTLLPEDQRSPRLSYLGTHKLPSS